MTDEFVLCYLTLCHSSFNLLFANQVMHLANASVSTFDNATMTLTSADMLRTFKSCLSQNNSVLRQTSGKTASVVQSPIC